MSYGEYAARRVFLGFIICVLFCVFLYLLMRALGDALPGGSWTRFLNLGSQIPAPAGSELSADWLKFALLGTITCALSAGWLNFVVPAAYFELPRGSGHVVVRTNALFKLFAGMYAIFAAIFTAFVAAAAGDSIFIVAIAGGIALPLATGAAILGMAFTGYFNRPLILSIPAAGLFVLLVRLLG